MSTDSEIIRASLDAPERFAEIFERHAVGVQSFIVSRVGRGSKDDLLSETFLVAFRGRAKFDRDVTDAKPWLLGIATRLIRRHRAVEAAHWRSFIAASAAGGFEISHDLDDASERVDAAARVRELGPRIAALTPRDRDTLFLYAWGDLTYEQIATTLKVPVGTVRSRLNRIRARLAAPPLKPTGAPTSAHHTQRKGIDNGSIEQRA